MPTAAEKILDRELTEKQHAELMSVLAQGAYVTSILVALSDWLEAEDDARGAVTMQEFAEQFAEHEAKVS